jgi:hypothetical protein
MVGTKEMACMMIIDLTEEGNMIGMIGGMVIHWYGHTAYIHTYIHIFLAVGLEFTNHEFAFMFAGPICHCCCQGTAPED